MFQKFLSIFKPTQKHYTIYRKGENLDLEHNLSLKEFQCKCHYEDCNRVIIESSIPESFQKTRVDFLKPIYVSSGHRCQKHNSDQSNSSDDSDHIWGEAIDLVPMDGDIFYLDLVARRHFKKVLNYGSYLHCSN